MPLFLTSARLTTRRAYGASGFFLREERRTGLLNAQSSIEPSDRGFASARPGQRAGLVSPSASRFRRWAPCLLAAAATAAAASAAADEPAPPATLRIGIIGLDTSHVIQFTKMINQQLLPEAEGARVVLAYPQGSPDIASSVSRVPGYIEQVQAMGVEIVDTIEEVAAQCDAVLLETNDGRPHLRQALPVLKARKRMFIDKPMAGSLADVIALFDAAEHYQTPIFSTSALRYGPNTLEVHGGAIGRVLGADAFGPCSIEPTHPDLFWYGIHGVEALFTVMGVGCQTVARTSTADAESAAGVWEGGRIGTFRGMRVGAQQFGGMAFGEKENRPIGSYVGYEPLVADILKFFRGAAPPVTRAETEEIFAFMEAADESKRRGGTPVPLKDLIDRARADAAQQRSW